MKFAITLKEIKRKRNLNLVNKVQTKSDWFSQNEMSNKEKTLTELQSATKQFETLISSLLYRGSSYNESSRAT